MRGQLKQLPEAIRKQVLLRFGMGLAFLVLFLIISLCFLDLYLSLPCLLFAGFLIVSGGWLFYNGLTRRYIRLDGICSQIETTGIQKRIRYIYVILEQHIVKIPVRQRIKKLTAGDTVIIYLSDKEPVYEQDNGYMICNYYALEIRKEGCK